MAAKTAKVVVAQNHNPKFDATKTPEEQGGQRRWIYQVQRATSTTVVELGQWLTKDEVDKLIADEITVDIVWEK